jgi:hypothetical protein
MLHDDVLLAIFDFYVEDPKNFEGRVLEKVEIEVWQSLVHVCRRWRSVVFGSPRRLKLHLVCTVRTPAPETIDVWPALPLLIRCGYDERIPRRDNILAALKRRDRICRISFEHDDRLSFKKVLELMQVPFPELTHLLFVSDYRRNKIIPDSFLGGTVPRLQSLYLDHLQFPGLPKLLSSATQLADIYLNSIPLSGYISPEVMVTCLSTMINLKSLHLAFSLLPSAQKSQPRHLSNRSVLPALRRFQFKGTSRYLEDFVARVDSPKLDTFVIKISLPLRDTPQLDHFISRTTSLPENAPVARHYVR